MKHFLLFYEAGPDYLARRPQFREEPKRCITERPGCSASRRGGSVYRGRLREVPICGRRMSLTRRGTPISVPAASTTRDLLTGAARTYPRAASRDASAPRQIISPLPCENIAWASRRARTGYVTVSRAGRKIDERTMISYG